MNNTDKGSEGYLISIVMVAVLGGLLFGYDTAVISGAEKGLQAFFMEAKDFSYTDGWHGFTSASALIGCIIGSALSGFLATNLGRKRSLIVAGLLFFVSALGSMEPEFLFFEHGTPTYSLLIMFNLYRVIGGIGVGLASAICPMYIGEVAPSNIRGMLVSWNQFAIIFGQLVVYFVNFFILGDHIQPLVEEMGKGIAAINPAAQWTVTTGWRYMFGSEAVPAGLFALLICFVPETPRYLVSIGRDDVASRILTKINGSSKAAQILQDIKDTMVVKTEKLMTYGAMCIFVGIMLSVFQQAVGINAVLYYAPRIFGDMGMDNPMMITVFMGVINILFTLVAIFTVEKWGRKPLLIYGSLGMALGAFGVAATFGTPEWRCSRQPRCSSIRLPSCSRGGPSPGFSLPRSSRTPSVVGLSPLPWPSNGYSTSSFPARSYPCSTCTSKKVTTSDTGSPMAFTVSSACWLHASYGDWFLRPRARRWRT